MLQGLKSWEGPESNCENTYPNQSSLTILQLPPKSFVSQYFLSWIISVKKTALKSSTDFWTKDSKKYHTF